MSVTIDERGLLLMADSCRAATPLIFLVHHELYDLMPDLPTGTIVQAFFIGDKFLVVGTLEPALPAINPSRSEAVEVFQPRRSLGEADMAKLAERLGWIAPEKAEHLISGAHFYSFTRTPAFGRAGKEIIAIRWRASDITKLPKGAKS